MHLKTKKLFHLAATGTVLAAITLGLSCSNIVTSSAASVQLVPSFDISPDGQTIVYAGAGSGGQDLYLMNVASRRVTRLCDTPTYEMEPRFSPDGRHIAFVAAPPDFSKASHIYSCNADGSHRAQVTLSGKYDLYPVCLNSAGTKIAFARSNLRRPYSWGGYISTDYDIWTIDTATNRERQLTRAKYSNIYSTDVSPSGSLVLYSGEGEYPHDDAATWSVPASGSAAAPTHLPAASAHWSNGGPGYAVFSRPAKGIDLIAGPVSDAADYAWEIDACPLKGGAITRLALIPGLLSAIHCDNAGKYIYYLLNANADARIPKYEMWRLDRSTKRREMLGSDTLVSEPLAPPK